MPRLTFFTRRDCPLCDAAWFVVAKVAASKGESLSVDQVILEFQ